MPLTVMALVLNCYLPLIQLVYILNSLTQLFLVNSSSYPSVLLKSCDLATRRKLRLRKGKLSPSDW